MAAKKKRKRKVKRGKLILRDFRSVWNDMRNADPGSIPELVMKESFKKHGFEVTKYEPYDYGDDL